MIRLYLVRHGIAVDTADWKGAADELRPLTGKGRRRFRKAARAFGKLAGKVDLILTSPLVRAVQTAEILAGEVKHGEVAVLEELASGGVAALLAAVGKRARTGKSLALVGHEPQLSSTLAELAHLRPEESSKLDVRKGAIVRVDVSSLPDAKTAQPRWWVKPRSGARAKGLPLQKPPPPARPPRAAKPAKATGSRRAGAKEAAANASPARKEAGPRATKRARRATTSPAAKAAAEAANSAAGAGSSTRAGEVRPQTFMGSPRHQGSAQTAPAQPGPPAPAPARPAEPVAPPHNGSGSGPVGEE